MEDAETLFSEKFSEESRNMRSRLNYLRKEKNFCDLTLKTKDGTLFEVHKNILYSLCGFFQGLFDSLWTETNNDVIELDINIEPEALELILEYIYNGSIEKSKINFDIAVKLFTAASFLNMGILKDLIEEYLIRTLSLDSSLILWRKEIPLSEHVNDKTIEFIKNNCNEFLNYHMLELKIEELKNILSFDDLECPQENLLSNILQWIKIDFDERQIYIKDFFGQINFKEVSPHYIVKNIIEDETLFKNLTLMQFISKEMSSRLENQSKISYFSKSETNKLLLITETSLFKIDTIKEKVIKSFDWKLQKEDGFSVTKYNCNDLFFTGPKEICEYFGNNESHQLPSMLKEKQYHSSINFANNIYCCGGYNYGTGYRNMDIFDLYHMKWIQGSSMNQQRYEFALIDYANSIYAIGGNGSNGLPGLVEKYDPRTDKWINLAVLGEHIHTYGHSTGIVHNDKIYASVFDCIHKFNPINSGLEIVKSYKIDGYSRLIPFSNQENLYAHCFNVDSNKSCWIKLKENTEDYDKLCFDDDSKKDFNEDYIYYIL